MLQSLHRYGFVDLAPQAAHAKCRDIVPVMLGKRPQAPPHASTRPFFHQDVSGALQQEPGSRFFRERFLGTWRRDKVRAIFAARYAFPADRALAAPRLASHAHRGAEVHQPLGVRFQILLWKQGFR
jgi:hypothetical protein